MMHDQSIVTKIVGSACGIVCVLLVLGGFILINFEIDLIETLTRGHLERITQSIEKREKADRASLRKNIEFNIEILSKMSVLFLDNFNPDGLRQSLHAYMNYPEILAISVTDEDGEPFAAAWRSPGIATGHALPLDLSLNDRLSVQTDAVRDGKKWGTLRICYSDAILIKKSRIARENSLEETEIFKKDSQRSLKKAMINQGIGILLILLVLILCLIVSLRSLVLEPLKMVSDAAYRLADFDLSVSIPTKRKDEIGTLLTAINKMGQEFRSIVSDVKSGGERLAHASGQMRENISTVALAAREISVNVGNVSQTAEQVSQNNILVAGSIDKMSGSMNDVGMSAYQGSRISGDAVVMADKARETMTLLGEAATRIGEVTEVIRRIAEKTTLLALNADIEAASAGPSGRGFAVVANEIREFARQSTRAAEDIAGRISEMQKNTEQAVSVINEVSGVIHQIHGTSENISLAIEEQIRSANEIASNAGQINVRSRDIAESMEELAQRAYEVSMRVGMAVEGKGGEAQNDGEDSSPHIDASATEVAKLAKNLLELVGKFKI